MEKRRVGRPKKSMRDTKRKDIHIKLTDEEYDYIYYKSVSEKCSISEVVRRTIFGNFCGQIIK